MPFPNTCLARCCLAAKVILSPRLQYYRAAFQTGSFSDKPVRPLDLANAVPDLSQAGTTGYLRVVLGKEQAPFRRVELAKTRHSPLYDIFEIESDVVVLDTPRVDPLPILPEQLPKVDSVLVRLYLKDPPHR